MDPLLSARQKVGCFTQVVSSSHDNHREQGPLTKGTDEKTKRSPSLEGLSSSPNTVPLTAAWLQGNQTTPPKQNHMAGCPDGNCHNQLVIKALQTLTSDVITSRRVSKEPWMFSKTIRPVIDWWHSVWFIPYYQREWSGLFKKNFYKLNWIH